MLEEKATTKKRPTTTGDASPPKKSKGFTAHKKAEHPSLSKVEKSLKSEDTMAIVTFIRDDIIKSSTVVKQSDTVVLLDSPDKADGKSTQPNATKDGSAFSSPVARVVSQIPPSL